ncbi:MAG: response regulator [Candidatus Omnitrophica bacterium]|nr:response regulator [Candidatus Omnitrophota bacterium]
MRKKILVIDDEELITKTFCKLLEKSGLEVLIAKRYDDALILAEESDFDLIISDIRMPGQSGVDTVSQIRDTLKGRGKNIPPGYFYHGFHG